MDIAMKYMKLLGHETSETVNLAMLDCDRIVYLHRVDSPHVLRPNFSLMERYPAVQTGLGLVLLADLNSAGLQWVYQNNADTLHIPYEEFTEQIAQIRRQGYAYDDQLFCEGLRCVAAPICGPGGKALFSISVSAPSLRMDDARYELVRQLVVALQRPRHGGDSGAVSAQVFANRRRWRMRSTGDWPTCRVPSSPSTGAGGSGKTTLAALLAQTLPAAWCIWTTSTSPSRRAAPIGARRRSAIWTSAACGARCSSPPVSGGDHLPCL